MSNTYRDDGMSAGRPVIQKTQYYARPEPGSINDRIRSNPDQSLYVRPIYFTDEHSRVLRVSWNEVFPDHSALGGIEGVAEFSNSQTACSAEQISRLATKIWDLPQYQDSRVHPLHRALDRMFGYSMDARVENPSLRIWFGGKSHRDLTRANGFWNYSNPDLCPVTSFHSGPTNVNDSFSTTVESPAPTIPDIPILPMMAHISRRPLSFYRRAPFRVPLSPNLAPNKPVESLVRLRAKMLLPANPNHDSFLISIFLAMAQQYFYTDGSPPLSQLSTLPPPCTRMPDFHDLKLRLLVDDTDPATIIVYTTTVTAAFLRQFHEPSKAFYEPTSEPARMNIEYTKVMLEPIDTFRTRLGLALGEDIVGSLVVAKEDPKDAAPSTKRKRHSDADEKSLDEKSLDDTVGEFLKGCEEQPSKRHCRGANLPRSDTPDDVKYGGPLSPADYRSSPTIKNSSPERLEDAEECSTPMPLNELDAASMSPVGVLLVEGELSTIKGSSLEENKESPPVENKGPSPDKSLSTQSESLDEVEGID